MSATRVALVAATVLVLSGAALGAALGTLGATVARHARGRR